MDSIYEDNLVTSFVMLTAGVKLKQSREKQTFVCKRGFFAESLKLATSFNHFSSSLLFTDDRKMTEQCFFFAKQFSWNFTTHAKMLGKETQAKEEKYQFCFKSNMIFVFRVRIQRHEDDALAGCYFCSLSVSTWTWQGREGDDRQLYFVLS